MEVFITGGSGYLGRPRSGPSSPTATTCWRSLGSESAARTVAELARRPFKANAPSDVLRAAAAQADASIQLAQEWSPDGAELDRAAAARCSAAPATSRTSTPVAPGCGEQRQRRR